MPEGRGYISCPDCGSWVTTGIGYHYCVVFKSGRIESSKMRKWDQSKGAWVSDSLRYWDHSKGAWVVDPSHSHEVNYEVSSCEIPTKQVAKSESTEKTYTPYVTVKPWEHVDRVKWSETWRVLVLLYYAKDWHAGKYIPEVDYENRITNGIYAPEPRGWRDWRGEGDDGNPYYMGD